MKILLTGGAGFIGSHAVRRLLQAGHEPVVLDNLTRGHRHAVPSAVVLIDSDLCGSTATLTEILGQHEIDAVMHFAALAYVGESVREPLNYYANNTAGSLNLLQAMNDASVNRLVFSSTCATYGQVEPENLPIDETTQQQPINPYGRSKLFVEQMVRDHAASRATFGYAILRYFNVAGSDPAGEVGEEHHPETHLIPLAIQAALGQRGPLTVYGDDYDTTDGTCIRDYIHVEDLVAAHLRALDALDNGVSYTFNLGTGRGVSVKEILDSVARVTGREVPHSIGPRRAGDPAALYADADRIEAELGWRAAYTDLDETVRTAFQWLKDHPPR